MKILKYLFIIVLLVFYLGSEAASQITDAPFEIARRSQLFSVENRDMRLLLNTSGMMGLGASPYLWGVPGFQYYIGFKYPPGDTSEHLLWAALWVGAGRKTSSDTSYLTSVNIGSEGGGRNYSAEMYGDIAKGDGIIWRTHIGNELGSPYDDYTDYYKSLGIQVNRRGFDDDGDGFIDEDPLDGLDNDGDWLEIRDDLDKNRKPDHGEPNVDEDFGAISESDISFSYRDSLPFTVNDPLNPTYKHIPLGIKIIQSNYAWKTLLKEPILPVVFTIVNVGSASLDSAYIGIFAVPWVGDFGGSNCGIGIFPNPNCPYWRQTIGYITDVKTTFVANYYFESTPFGLTLLGGRPLLPDAKLTFQWWKSIQESPSNELQKYQTMSLGQIQSTAGTDTGTGVVFLLSIGPFERMEPGDTAHFAIAFVAGNTVESGPSNVRSSAAIAQELYARNWTLPNAPPSPPLRRTIDERGITLDYKWRPGDSRFDPLDAWDESNNLVNALPDTHWRRRNPPPGKTRGGRTFEGFRIWRSSYPLFDEKQFSLLHQFDVIDDLGFEGQTGIEFTYTDSAVSPGKTYWYAVTSISVPDYIILTDTMLGTTDTVWLDPAESFIHENAIKIQMPFAPSTQLNKVKVVPNPYRTDMDYTYEGGGWEGLGRQWVEDKRVVWFIHLPPKCTIRIFTIAGEVVKTISHDDAQREANGLAVGQEEFILLSESNRALASGIYVYLVESEYGTQTGKFVVIR
jgi:hypothetical protein